MMSGESEQHGLDGYRKRHCRCETCLAANRHYMAVWRARRRGLGEPVRRPKEPGEAQLEKTSTRDSRGRARPKDPVPSLEEAKVMVLPGGRPAPPPEGPGPNEQGVIDRCTGLTAAPDHPEWVAAARALARILDDKRQVTSQPSAARQLLAVMDKIEAASVIGRKNRLAAVSAMSRTSSAGVAG